MTSLATVTADQLILAFIAATALREALVWLLPDSIAGPRGWLLRTGDDG